MSMNGTPGGERIHIGLFGRRNAGKSSIMNALIGQELSIVSEVKGTTTDPVHKSMELLPLGPVVFVDTPGLDDEGELGMARIEKSDQILDRTDIALVVVDATEGKGGEDEQILSRIREKRIPYVVVYNKQDLIENDEEEILNVPGLLADYNRGKEIEIRVSARKHYHIQELKEFIAGLKPDAPEIPIVADLIQRNDFVVLVVPIDKAAPKGRLILPQQQTIRELLDAGSIPVVTRETELKQTLQELGKAPALVITDSQVFELVAGIVPESIPLTSFSILFARHKGVLQAAVRGADMLEQLQDKDRILIAEGCTHHRQCGDIGTEKLPRWIQKQAEGKKLEFDFCSGMEFPRDLSVYRLVIQCGGCMLNEREVKNRYELAENQGAAMTNYGIVISKLKGILTRSIAMLAGEEK